MDANKNIMPIIIHALANPVKSFDHQYKNIPIPNIPTANTKSTILFIVKLFIPFIL